MYGDRRKLIDSDSKVIAICSLVRTLTIAASLFSKFLNSALGTRHFSKTFLSAMPMILFETERLICRRLSLADMDEMYAVYSDADAMRWVDDGQPIERNECSRWLTVTLGNYESRGYGMSTLVSKDDGTVIGFCGLVHPNNQPEAEIKYALHRRFWGAGLATEAVKGMLAYGRREHQMAAVIATVAPENIASRRVLLKAGMAVLADRCDENDSSIMVFRWQAD